MRLSPLLVAFVAASTTLGLSPSAQGQSANSSLAGTKPASGSATKPASKPVAARKTFKIEIKGFKAIAPSGSPAQRVKPSAGSANIVIPAASADASPLSPADLLALPPLYAQAGPGQDTPDRIRVNPLSPGSPQPTTPTIQTPTPTPSPAPTDSPAPEASPTPTPETPLPTPEPAIPSAPAAPPSQSTQPEPRVLVAEVLVRGVEGTLLDEVYRAIRTQPGRTTTRSQLQEDINAIFATGYFSNVRAVPEDTPLGVRVTFEVQLNPVLNSVRVEGNRVLPEQVITDAFSDQYGRVLNLNELQEGIKKVNKWYQDNGYVLAQVLDSPAVAPDGTVTLQVAEGEIESIQVRYINKEGNECIRDEKGNFFLKDPETGNPELDKSGNPAKCRIRTRAFIITREFELKPGDIFNRKIVEQDLQRVYGLGILEDARLALQPSETDPRKVVVVANVVEKNTGSIFASAGISSASGLFGSVGYQQQNLGGNNQKLAAEVQVGQRELLFDLSFTDPWIAGDPYRTSYTFNLFRRRTISLIFDGGDPDIDLPNGDTPRIVRTGGILSFTRPLSRNVFRRAEWTASLGLQYQRISIRDRDGDLSPVDQLGNDLTFSGEGRDDLFTIQFGVVRDRRNDPLRPTQGSLLRLGTEQSIPIGLGSIFFNRLRGSYSFYVPTRFVRFTPGCRLSSPKSSDCPQAFAFNVQAGTVVGDLPPYESFALGGSNSVRGFDEGDLAAARSFIQGTIEYRFPIFSIISGALFVDAATDFGTQSDVPGNPGGVRNKPGSGVGYGVGIRVQSPLGPIRIDYGFNSEGDSRLHFGIGERF